MTRRTPRLFFAFVTATALSVASCSSASTDAADTTGTSTPSSATSTTAAPSASATTTAAAAAELTPIVGSITAPPIPVPATDGKIHLAYEINLTNFVSQPVTVQSITVSDGDTVLQNLTPDVLPEWTKVFGTDAPGTTFGPGQSGLVWIDAVVDSADDVPDTLENRISVTLANPSPPVLPASLTYSVAPVTVDKVEPVKIAPPLRGERWVDGNGCCSVTAHRGAVSPLNGKLWAPERFAIDWVQLDSENRLFTGDKTSTASYPYFGDDVMAVADGKVVAVVDGLPEQTPGANPTGLPVDQYGGNHVVQDIGNGHYAFYAHLQTGSTSRVKVGDDLKAGDVVGLLGNSGNTDSPHLHFHVMDGIDPLVSNGLPFEFESFDTTGEFASSDAVDQLLETSAPAQLVPGVTTEARTNQMPLFLDVVTFPAG